VVPGTRTIRVSMLLSPMVVVAQIQVIVATSSCKYLLLQQEW